ncbi:MAG: hypothetical protein AAB575_01485 [Patescibacteria group bacterium]
MTGVIVLLTMMNVLLFGIILTINEVSQELRASRQMREKKQ